MRLLIAEDDRHIAEIYREILIAEGYSADTVFTGEQAEILAQSIPYDLILLDIMLPGKNGFEVCKDLRKNGIDTPVIMISGYMKEESDIILGLDYGAVEYLTKPVTPTVLAARVRALLRNKHNLGNPRIQLGDLTIDTAYQQLRSGDREILLTNKEYAILEYLILHSNLIVSRTELEQHVWGLALDTSSNIIDVHIKNLRAKLGVNNQGLIETIRGRGYRLIITG